ncbi:MAG: xanthine dehydrogenase small subunit [Tepidimonas sp.]|nr:xanthine dehydrogenase small subunit [Tepidimonas sp.]
MNRGSDSNVGQLAAAPIRLVHRGRVVTLPEVPPDLTLLELLRQRLGLSGVKEGCAAGDCGACTVAVAERDPAGGLRWRALNSCIRLAHSVAGCAVWSAQDLGADPLIERGGQALHPVQQALLDAHASQCGFCTPGIVMSLFVLQQRQGASAPVTRPQAQQALSGNLCRCTGYRPILQAAEALPTYPAAPLDRPRLLALLAQAEQAMQAEPPAAEPAYVAPRTEAAALQARQRWPQAVLVAGGTDACLQLTQQRRRWHQVLDLSRCTELQRIEHQRDPDGAVWLRLGAAATLHDAFAALQAHWPALRSYWERFAGAPVRDGGTLGGNVANASPIGDSMPVLIALGARVVLAAHGRAPRQLALEDFYLGYRRTALAADELLTHLLIPLPAAGMPPLQVAAHKLSKRLEDDIAAVSLALAWRLDERQRVIDIRIGAGGVAPTPMRARAAEAALLGQPWRAASVRAAMQALQDSVQPLSDGRASAAYRRAMLGNLLWRTWLEHGGATTEVPLRLDESSAWQRLQALTERSRA